MRHVQRLGRYNLTDRIAFGGMAEIYRAFTYDKDGARKEVAIKKLLPHYLEDGQFLQMLTDEFKLVSYLKHPNIADVYELVQVDGSILIAMEYVDGKDLRSVVERAKRAKVPLQFDDIAYVMARALDGLHHAHMARDDQGQPMHIVHRDFSPSNVLISYDGNVKICDFGIAKATHSQVETKSGIIKGKVKYMSPEQAFGKKLDGRSDLFSAGSVLYELLTGRAPFVAANEIDLIFAVRDATPTPVRELNPNIPDELAAITDKSMTRSRSGRFQTAMEFRDALLRFLRQYNPNYRRTKLARFIKTVCADDIDNELRSMQEYVLEDSAPPPSYGRNLIADALGPNAAYTQFSAVPTQHQEGPSNVGGGAPPKPSAHTKPEQSSQSPQNIVHADPAPPSQDVNDDEVHDIATQIIDATMATPSRGNGEP